MDEVQGLKNQIEQGKYKRIIFDLDETLTHVALAWPIGIKLLIERSPAEHQKHMREQFAGMSYSDIVNPVLVNDPDFLPVVLSWANEFEQTATSHRPYKELVEYIPELSKIHDLFIWTSNTSAIAEWTLGELEILQHFDKIVAREDVRLIKPEVEGWQYIDDGTDPSHYLFVGDSVYDQKTAETLGMDFYKITYFKKPKT